MWLNGIPGVKYGLNYPVQLRGSFGFGGGHVPVILRGLAGLMWFGIEAWAGSLAITMIIVKLTGVPNDQVTAVAIKYIIPALLVYLGSFVLVMLFGLQGIGKMANWAGPIMLIYFVWLVIFLLTRAEFQPNIPEALDEQCRLLQPAVPRLPRGTDQLVGHGRPEHLRHLARHQSG